MSMYVCMYVCVRVTHSLQLHELLLERGGGAAAQRGGGRGGVVQGAERPQRRAGRLRARRYARLALALHRPSCLVIDLVFQ